MRHWTFWEWTAYVALFVAALIISADTGFRESPDVMARLPEFFHSELWGFAPVVLVVVATIILLLREFVFVNVSPSYFIGLYKNKTRERVSVEAPQVGLSVEDQQFRSGIRTFVLSNIDELSRQFGWTIGLSIADYRNRTKDEFLGDLVEKLFQKSFYKNQNHILELFANNSQPDVDISQEAIKAYLLSYREAYQVLLQFRQYAKVTTNATDTFNKWLDADVRALHSFRDLKSFMPATILQRVDDGVFISRSGQVARMPESP